MWQWGAAAALGARAAGCLWRLARRSCIRSLLLLVVAVPRLGRLLLCRDPDLHSMVLDRIFERQANTPWVSGWVGGTNP